MSGLVEDEYQEACVARMEQVLGTAARDEFREVTEFVQQRGEMVVAGTSLIAVDVLTTGQNLNIF